jgi:[NiFe] hydrogenase assembly HybE family chaperone
LHARTQALEALFVHVARNRMAGVPVLHPGLRVEAVGFMPHAEACDEGLPGALGVLITPWFMNLLWLPLAPCEAPRRVGLARERTVGGERFEFIAAHEPGFGFHEACSLFSPMFQFADHDAARATALAVLASLRAVPEAAPVAQPAPPRRAFLFGRSAAAGPAA